MYVFRYRLANGELFLIGSLIRVSEGWHHGSFEPMPLADAVKQLKANPHFTNPKASASI